MKQKLILSVLVVCAVLVSAQSIAQPPCRRMAGTMNEPQGWGCPVWMDLAPEQQEAINVLLADFRNKTSGTQNQIYKKCFEMDTLLLEAEPDTGKLVKLQKEISGLNARMDEEQLAYILKARKNLSPEQIAQLPPGCSLGLGASPCSPRAGAGAGMGCGGMGCGRFGGCGR